MTYQHMLYMCHVVIGCLMLRVTHDSYSITTRISVLVISSTKLSNHHLVFYNLEIKIAKI